MHKDKVFVVMINAPKIQNLKILDCCGSPLIFKTAISCILYVRHLITCTYYGRWVPRLAWSGYIIPWFVACYIGLRVMSLDICKHHKMCKNVEFSQGRFSTICGTLGWNNMKKEKEDKNLHLYLYLAWRGTPISNRC